MTGIATVYVQPPPLKLFSAHNVRVKLDGGLDMVVARCDGAKRAAIVAGALLLYATTAPQELHDRLWAAKTSEGS